MTTRLAPADYLDHIRSESRRFRDVLADCDPAARVPACPDWDAVELLWHLAEVQWFWSRIIQHRPAGPGGLEHPARPDSRPGVLESFDDWSEQLVSALADAGPDEPAWSWAPEQTVGFSYRRQAHEALIHRLDAEQAAGSADAVSPLDPSLAVDGVAELLEVMYGGEPPAWATFRPGPHYARIDLPDVGASLWARPGMISGTDPDSGETVDGPHLLAVEHPGTEASVVVSGAAGDVDAWLWGRHDGASVTITGDAAAYTALRSALSEPLG